MRTLIMAIVLGLTLALPASSFAGVNALGVKLPIDRSEPMNNVESGFVPETAAGSYKAQSLGEETITYENDSFSYSTFGVDLESATEG